MADIQVYSLPPEQVEMYDYCVVVRLQRIGPEEDAFDVSEENYDLIFDLINLFGKNYVYQYDLLHKRLRFVLIKVSISRIKTFAEKLNYRMLLDNTAVQSLVANDQYDPEEGRGAKKVDQGTPAVSQLSYLYGPYLASPVVQSVYWRPNHMKHPFRRSVRVALASKLLQDVKEEAGLMLDLDKMRYRGDIVAHFPVHSVLELRNLENKLLTAFPPVLNLPLFEIKEYFGESTGLFFHLLGHMAKFYSPVAVIGLGFQIYLLATGSYQHFMLPIHAFLVCVWLTVMMEYYRFLEKYVAIYWGVHDLPGQDTVHELEMNIRPEFVGIACKSPIDGKQILSYPNASDPVLRLMLSYFLWAATLLLPLLAVTGVYILGAQLHSLPLHPQYIVSVITGFLMIGFNSLLFWTSIPLTRFENHRVDRTFQRSLQWKVLLGQAINNLSSLFYLSFISSYLRYIPRSELIASYIRQAERDVHVPLIGLNIAIVFGVRLLCKIVQLAYLYLTSVNRVTAVKNNGLNDTDFIKIYGRDKRTRRYQQSYWATQLEWLKYYLGFSDEGLCCGAINICVQDCRYCFHRVGACCHSVYRFFRNGWDTLAYYCCFCSCCSGREVPEDDISAEVDLQMKLYDPAIVNVKLYSEVISNFTFVLFFSGMLPGLTPLGLLDLCLIHYHDSFVLLHRYQRYYNSSLIVNTIGHFYSIMEAVLCLGYFVCTGLVVFTMTNLDFLSLVHRLWIVVGLLVFFFGFKFLLRQYYGSKTQYFRLHDVSLKYVTGLMTRSVYSDPNTIL